MNGSRTDGAPLCTMMGSTAVNFHGSSVGQEQSDYSRLLLELSYSLICFQIEKCLPISANQKVGMGVYAVDIGMKFNLKATPEEEMVHE